MSIYTNLPSMELTFEFNVEGSMTKHKYTGSFTFKRPTLGERSEISKTAARYGAEVAQSLDAEMKITHYMMAWLKHTLINYPKWWEDSKFGFELYDDNVLTELMVHTSKFEEKWSNDVKAIPNSAKKNG